MLGKIEGGRRRGRQRIRWLDGITDMMDTQPATFSRHSTQCSAKDGKKVLSSSKRLVGELFSKETCLLREEGCFHSERLVCSDPEEVATSGLIFQLLSRGCPPGMPSGSVNHRCGDVC